MNASNLTSGPTPDLDPATSPMKDIAKFMLYVGYVVVPAFLVLGVCGNIITIVVMRSKSFCHLPTSYVLIALAISDTALNIMVPFNKGFVRELLGTDIRSYSDLGCNIFFWAWRTAKMTSSWLVVLICAERVIAVCMPIRAPTINSKRNVKIAVAIIYLVIGGYVAVWSGVTDRRVGGICRPNTQPPGLEGASTILMYMGAFVYAPIPSALLICGTVVTIVGLHMARRRRRLLTASVRGNIPRDPTAKTTVMLLSVSIAFVLLVLPIGLAHLICFIQGCSLFESTSISFIIFREVAQLLEQLNYSINFLLYVAASQGFRDRLLVTLCGKGSKGQAGIQRTRSKPGSEVSLTCSMSTKGTDYKEGVIEEDAEVPSKEHDQETRGKCY